MKNYVDWQISLSSKITRINERLLESITTSEPFLYEMAKYTIEAGGKRFRPLLTILVYGIVSEHTYDNILDLAAGYELIHTASLIHDDIIDNSPIRRNRPTLNKKYGMENAIVVGDFLFARAYELGSRYGPVVSRIMADGSSKLAEGQTLEFLNRGNPDIDEETYLKIISGKTAHFFEACARGASVAGDASPEIVEALSQFAFNLGMAFQITDDILDFISSENSVGKPVLHDMRESTITLPVIRAVKASGEARDIVADILKGNDTEIENLKQHLIRTGSLDYSFKVASNYIQLAVKYLQKAKRSPDMEALMDLAMLVIDRISSLK